MSITVTEWATLSQPAIVRGDSITEISQYSQFKSSFNIPFPVDAGCRLKIIFPDDMKLDSGLTSVSGFGLFEGLSTFTTNSIASNYVELDGCLTYTDGG